MVDIITSMQGKSLSIAEKTNYLLFMINAFQVKVVVYLVAYYLSIYSQLMFLVFCVTESGG